MESKQPGTRLWTLPFTMMITLNLLFGLVQMITQTTLPVYIISQSGSAAKAGLIVGIFSFAALLSRPFFGHFLDRHNRQIVLVISSILYLVSYGLLNIPMSVDMVIVLRVLQGFGFGGVSTTMGTMVAELIHPSRMAAGIGIFGLSYTLSTAVAPIIAFAIVNKQDLGYPALFILITVISGLGFLLSFAIKDHRPHAAAVEHGREMDALHHQMKLADRIYEKTALPPALVMLCLAISLSGIYSFLTSYAAWRGIQNVGLFFTFYSVAILLARLSNNALLTRLGMNRLVYLTILLIVCSLVALAFAGSLAIFIIVAILYGLGYGVINPLLNALVFQLSPVSRRGTANATFYLAMDIGMGSGSILLGLLPQILPEASGYPAIFLTSAVIALIGAGLYTLILQPKIRKYEAFCKGDRP